MIDYDEDNRIGTIEANTEKGIFGTLDEQSASGVISSAMPIGLKQEVKEGEAEILCSLEASRSCIPSRSRPSTWITNNVNRGLEITVHG